MARSGLIIGLVLLALAGPSRAAERTPAPRARSGIKAMLLRAISPIRFHQLYSKERRARDVGQLMRRSNALAWRATLPTLNPWSKRTLDDQIADCRLASQLNDQGSAQLRAAREATLAKARRAGIAIPRGVLERWGIQPGAAASALSK